MAQHTAVEWLVRQLSNEFISEVFLHRWSEVSHLIDKAKQMEKEQIAESWNDGNFLGRNGLILEEYSTGKQYYKEKYGTV